MGTKADIGLAGAMTLSAGLLKRWCRIRWLLPGAAVFAELGIGRQRITALGAIHGLQWINGLRRYCAWLRECSGATLNMLICITALLRAETLSGFEIALYLSGALFDVCLKRCHGWKQALALRQAFVRLKRPLLKNQLGEISLYWRESQTSQWFETMTEIFLLLFQIYLKVF